MRYVNELSYSFPSSIKTLEFEFVWKSKKNWLDISSLRNRSNITVDFVYWKSPLATKKQAKYSICRKFQYINMLGFYKQNIFNHTKETFSFQCIS